MIFEDGGGGSSADRTVGPGRVPAEGGLPGVPKAKPGPTARTPRQQQQFDFNPASRGLFDHSESTLLDGENLDEPTYARRGVKLN